MDVLWAVVRRRIQQDQVKIRGSLRTKRLRKKRSKHLNELYIFYRDQIWLERHGQTYLEWRTNGRKTPL